MTGQRFIRHKKRPVWGIGLVMEEQGPRLKVRFEHGGERTLEASSMFEEVPRKDVPKSCKLLAAPKKAAKAKVTDPLAAETAEVILRATAMLLRDRLRRAFPPFQHLEDDESEDAAAAGAAVTRWITDFGNLLRVPYAKVKKVPSKVAVKLAQRAGGKALARSIAVRMEAVLDPHDTDHFRGTDEAKAFLADVLAELEPYGNDIRQPEVAILDEVIPWDSIQNTDDRT